MQQDLTRVLEATFGGAESVITRVQQELTDGMWMQDLREPAREWLSAGFFNALGYDEAEWVHREDVRSLLAFPEDLETADADLEACRRDPSRPYDHVVRYRRANGATVWMRRKGLVIRDADAVPIHLVGTFTDVTDLMDARSAIRTRDDHLAAMLGNTTAAIYAKKTDGTYLFANQSFTALCATTPEGIAHKTDADLFPPALAAHRREQDRRVIESASAIEVMEEIPCQGHTRTFMTTKFPLRRASGSIYSVASIGTDITELVSIRSELELLNLELDAKNFELEQFVYTVSHDLKSPIVTILGYLRHLMQDLQDQRMEDFPDYISRIRKAAERMRSNIDSLLELSRVGRVTPIPETIDLEPLTDAITESLTALLIDRDVTIHTDYQWPSLTLDRTHATQVLQNLIENAARYGCTDNRRCIEIGACLHEGSRVRMYVRDHGPGIEAHLRERIFGLFERLSNDDTGTGIGLAIVRRVVEINHGKIWVEDTPGGGATFWVDLPHAVPDTASAPIGDHMYATT